MKKISILLFTILSLSLFAQTTYVPDDNFEQALIDLGYDDVVDDYVLTANINTITDLDVKGEGISDLTGIEAFTALTNLDCSDNQLSNLDVSQNTTLTDLRCTNNYLTNLDLSQNLDLTHLFCSNNQLTNLDLSQTTALQALLCYNNQLSSLDLSQTTALTSLWCLYNQLNNLDVSQNTALTDLRCGFNQLTNLDVSQNTSLEELWCSGNQLTNLDVSQNTVLRDLVCRYNLITNLDVSQNTALDHLRCHSNQLTNLDLTQNAALEHLYCHSNELANLDIRNGNNTNITDYFYTSDNPNLTCIFVDDAAWSTANWTYIDPTSTFVETQAECDALGIDDAIFSQSLNIYPNPTTGIITIETFDIDAIDKIYLSDMLGQRIMDNKKSMQIDISDFSNGIYFLNIENKKGNKATYKVIKE